MIVETSGAAGAGSPSDAPAPEAVQGFRAPVLEAVPQRRLTDQARFPIGSVTGVLALAFRLAFARDPLGLLLVPYIIFFPFYVFFLLLAEIVPSFANPLDESRLFAAVFGTLPIVIFSRILGEAWTLVRSDFLGHGRPVGMVETFSHALGRSWHLFVVWIGVYVLAQIGFFLLVFPAFVVWVLCSFVNQAAVLGPGRFLRSIRYSRTLLRGNFKAWLGMVGLWLFIFLGLGAAVGFVRQMVLGPRSTANFALDLLLGTPLQVSLIVFTVCWTLFYRELEARSGYRRRSAPCAPGVPLEVPASTAG